jgi:hypothetical protein
MEAVKASLYRDLLFKINLAGKATCRPSWAIEAMKRCDEALNALSLQFFASVKRFIASLL